MSDDTLTTRLRELSKAIADGNRNELTMRVPAEPERDADLVLSTAADELTRLRAAETNSDSEISELSDQIDRLRTDNDTWRERWREQQAEIERLRSFAEAMAEGDCIYGDACNGFSLTKHGQCDPCKARAALGWPPSACGLLPSDIERLKQTPDGRGESEGPSRFEQLAAMEHERWSGWQQYLHSKCEVQPDGSLLIPAGLVERWERQIATPYDQLSEREKENDRMEVRKYWHLIDPAE